MKKRFADINILKGIGIILVVWGHIGITCSYDSGAYLPWYEIKSIIYSFHMPLFFIVSGFLAAYSTENRQIDYLAYVKKIVPRFVIPFFSFSLIIATAKLLSVHFSQSGLMYPVSVGTIYWNFINPYFGYAPLLWFIYTLFIIQLAYPLLVRLLEHDALVLVISLLFTPYDLPAVFCIGPVVIHLPFFAIGSILFKTNFRQPSMKKIHILWSCVAIMLFAMLHVYFWHATFSYFFLGCLGTYVCWVLSSMLAEIKLYFMEYIGKISLDIYLWHTTFNGVFLFMFSIILPANSFWLLAVTVCFSIVLVNVCLAKILVRFPKICYALYGRAAEANSM
ncbi:MAG: acyltransferase family protein [Pseudomonadota bacterium]